MPAARWRPPCRRRAVDGTAAFLSSARQDIRTLRQHRGRRRAGGDTAACRCRHGGGPASRHRLRLSQDVDVCF